MASSAEVVRFTAAEALRHLLNAQSNKQVMGH